MFDVREIENKLKRKLNSRLSFETLTLKTSIAVYTMMLDLKPSTKIFFFKFLQKLNSKIVEIVTLHET